jgi:hypothetical protein
MKNTSCYRRLNPIHVAAIFRRLASIIQAASQAQAATAAAAAPAGASAACQQIVRQLQGQLKQQHCIGHGPRGLANILAALAKLRCAPDFEMLQMLLQGFCSQLYDAVPEDIANVLWGAAQLTISYSASPAPGAAGANAAGTSFRDGAAAAASDVQQEGAAAEATDAASLSAGLGAAAEVHAGALQADVGLREQAAAGDAPSAAGLCTEATEAAACVQQALPASSGSAADTGTYAQRPEDIDITQQQQQQQQIKSRPPPLFTDPVINLQQVKLMLQRLCAVLNTANSQSVSNVAWGLTVLQHTHNWCMCGCLSLVRQMVMHFAVLPMLMPRHVQNVMHCMVQVRCSLLLSTTGCS